MQCRDDRDQTLTRYRECQQFLRPTWDMGTETRAGHTLVLRGCNGKSGQLWLRTN